VGQVIALLQKKGAVPFVDLAYQGFGDGLEEDAAATRKIAAAFPEVLIAASCSKNFGIYRERTGILVALTSPDRKAVVQGNLNFLNRQNYSFPPDHGARLVTMILEDADLTADWKAELEEVRQNMLGLRKQLADELRRATNSDRFDFVAQHRGMFSRLGLTEAQVNRLREEHGIYMVGDSRINIAGLNAKTVPVLAAAIAAGDLTPMLAVVLSLAAAAAFAASAMFIDQVSGRVGPLQLSRWQMSLAFLMTAAIVAVTGGWQTLDLPMVLWLTASSASGIMVGSLTYIATIQYTGPRISALLFTTASPFALVLGFGFRGETVSPIQAAGVGLIVAGIALAVMGPRGDEGARTPKPLGSGSASASSPRSHRRWEACSPARPCWRG
jgi:uncharacterized membrane protein